uniref:Uncharacterized protein n=1 Tax=Oryza brachyantha TaxID=4533 RepID=J3KWI0_ORYBR
MLLWRKRCALRLVEGPEARIDDVDEFLTFHAGVGGRDAFLRGWPARRKWCAGRDGSEERRERFPRARVYTTFGVGLSVGGKLRLRPNSALRLIFWMHWITFTTIVSHQSSIAT